MTDTKISEKKAGVLASLPDLLGDTEAQLARLDVATRGFAKRRPIAATFMALGAGFVVARVLSKLARIS